MTTNKAGIITTSIGAGNDYALSAALQADGKIVATGYSYNGKDYDFALVRYNPNGSLDTSFDFDGKLTTTISSSDVAYAVIVQPNGKIFVAGTTNTNIADFVAVRYNNDGSLDTSFDSDGKVTTDFNLSQDQGYDVAIQTDDKIVMVGNSGAGYLANIALVRYNVDGSLDTSGFGTNGKVITDVSGGQDQAFSVAMQIDGKILVSGQYYNASPFGLVVVRYSSLGVLDTEFGIGGKVITPLSSPNAGESLVVQTDGKILVAGSNGADFVLVRYTAAGVLDNSFGTNGIASTDFGGASDSGYSVALQGDGKILVAGSSSTDFALARYNSDGSLDNSFDADGKVTLAIGANGDVAQNVLVQSDGKIVVTGYSNNGTDDDFALVRYNADGSLDTTFDGLTPINHTPTGNVVISDTTPQQGQTLTAFNTLADQDGLGTISYVWKTGSTELGAGQTYTVTANEVGKTIQLIASYTDGLGNIESVGSTITSAVTVPTVPTTAGFTINPNTPQSTGEDGTSVHYSVSLKTQPLRDVTLTFTSSNTNEGVLDNGIKMTFTASNWNSSQTLTVRGVDDHLDDHDVAYRVTGVVSTIDVDYKLLTVTPLTLVNLDDGLDVAQQIYGDQGGSKVDKLQGTDGPDTIYGLNMADDLSGGVGNDTLWGGYGQDNLFGEDGNDKLSGEQDEDYLDGGVGNDTLDGGDGVDTMIGGAGNDIYYLGYDAVDVIDDQGLASDVDIVIMPYQLSKYTLPKGIEQGTIAVGTGSSSLTGNTSNNTLTGNDGSNLLNGAVGRDSLFGGAGNDVLLGGTGNDILSGGTGKDIFKFNVALTANTDKITDFVPVDDTIQLENAIFTKLATTGVLNAGMFIKAAAAQDSNDYIIYNPTTGTVSYDLDGSGAGLGVQIAVLGVNLALTNVDFVVI